MIETLSATLSGIPGGLMRDNLAKLLRPVADRLSSQMYSNSTLVIKAGGGTLAKTGAASSYGVAGGTPIIIGAGTDMPALTGLNIGAGKYNVFCFFCDKTGPTTGLSVLMGTEGATAAAVKFPSFPEGKALVGFLSVTYASAFTGGTTPLDTATTLYFSPTGAFDPSVVY